MKKLIIKEYSLYSDKINDAKKPPLLLLLSDMHNCMCGKNNDRLWKAIDAISPDAILIAGDLIIGKPGVSTEPALDFIRRACGRYPVYYAPGNHEQRAKLHPKRFGDMYQRYERVLKEQGVKYLENESVPFVVRGTSFAITGLAIPEKYYFKRCKDPFTRKEIIRLAGKPDKSSYQILLAHNPFYASAYFSWGADLTLSGHYHGGIVRLPFLNGLISPYLRLFPKFCYGLYEKDQSKLIVSAGIGEHTLPIRINNPRELVVLRFYGKQGETSPVNRE